MVKKTKQKAKVNYFSSFEEENAQEYTRRRMMSDEEKRREFEILQQRRWGSDWASKPIIKIVSYEKLF